MKTELSKEEYIEQEIKCPFNCNNGEELSLKYD
jgi:hypothetical protein